MHAPSREMKLEASRAGVLAESDGDGRIPRLQLVTVEQLFAGAKPFRAPGLNVTTLPKPSVPPPSGTPMQLALGLDTPSVAKAKPRAAAAPAKRRASR